MDFGSFTIGGIQVLVLVLGIVEAAKRWGVEGKSSEILAFVLGFVFIGVSAAIQAEIIPAVVVPYIELVIIGLGGALAATGVFDLLRKIGR